MIIGKSELSEFLGVTRSAVSNWIKRKKIIIKNGKIDTENSINKAFLATKQQISLVNDTNNNKNLQGNNKKYNFNKINEDKNTSNNNENHIEIDDLTELEAKDYLKTILNDDPKTMLATAQYYKTKSEAALKRIEVLEKANLMFSREVVDTHFISLFKIYYENMTNIPYHRADELINLVINNGLDCRGNFIKILHEDIVKECNNGLEKLKEILVKDFPIGEVDFEFTE